MDLTVRAITDAEVDLFRRTIARGFGGDLQEEDPTRFRKVFEIPRTIAAFDGPEMIGTCGAFSYDVTVPGGTLPMGGTTIITVQPTHRRRGVLTAMMRAHIAEMRGRGEPLAGLWASEASIYGRFGYGLTVEGHKMDVDGSAIEFCGAAPAGTVRLVEAEQASGPCRAVHESVRPRRPGMLSRSDAWWEWRTFGDPESHRDGRTAKRYALYEGASGVEGYAIYRQQKKWDDFPSGEVYVVELLATTPEAHHALWRYLTRIDLYPNVTYWNLPPDDALPWLITEPRRVRRSVTDSMWLRLLDVSRALGDRCYGASGRVVLGITDPFLPENDGCYELAGSSEGASCRRTDAPAEIELDIDALAALYLGAHRFSALAAARRVHGEPSALVTADRMFASLTTPWCAEVF